MARWRLAAAVEEIRYHHHHHEKRPTESPRAEFQQAHSRLGAVEEGAYYHRLRRPKVGSPQGASGDEEVGVSPRRPKACLRWVAVVEDSAWDRRM
ncbi:hypothetical protein K402DRAFT_155409 [Aulographum hederae CBS 113979]|uniref:Uncharacterized protein n=1 Tax=Aulographum hederae CBS 113979 TaxID=1176131 RepID=A0A6G1GS58_9PEZI|nr:hypothetical protein K402DRAFT_155409 [Aulographum hederae CBS 113979]